MPVDNFISFDPQQWETILAREEADRAAGAPMTALSQLVRLGLGQSSLNSVASNVPPALIARLVETGLWSPEQTITLTIAIPNPRQRVAACALLLRNENLVMPQREEISAIAVAALREVPESTGWLADASPRGHALLLVAPRLAGDPVAEALQMALALPGRVLGDTVSDRMRAIAALSPQLEGGLLDEALQAVTALQDVVECAGGLTLLARQLPKAQQETVWTQALDIALTRVYEPGEVKIIQGDQVSTVPTGGPSETDRLLAVSMLATTVEGALLSQVLDIALSAPQKAADEDTATEPGSGQRREPAWGRPFINIISGLVERLDPAQIGRVLETAFKIDDETYRVRTLAELAPYLTETQQAAVIETASTITDEAARITVLAGLGPHLQGALLDQVLQDELGLVVADQTEVRSPFSWVKKVISRPPPSESKIKDVKKRIDLLAAVAPNLSNAQCQAALNVTWPIKDERDRARLLNALVPQLAEAQQNKVIKEALKVVPRIKSDLDRAKALAELGRHVTGKNMAQVLQAVLKLPERVLGPGSRSPIAEALRELAPHLPPKLQAQALEAYAST